MKFRRRRLLCHIWELNISSVKKYGQNWRNLKTWRKSGKIWKKSRNRMKFRKRRLSYHIFEVKHWICEEIGLKRLKPEDLRSVLRKSKETKKEIKKNFLTSELRSRSKKRRKSELVSVENFIWSENHCSKSQFWKFSCK